mgnify:CR=1 FL=1
MANKGLGARRIGALVLGLCMPFVLGGCVWQAAQFWVAGEQVELRETDTDERPAARDAPQLLVVAIDGIDRHLLYDMLRAGELPEMARLLADDGSNRFANAWFEDSIVSVLPSSTAVSWATTVTGTNPAEHGVAGNEYFIRRTGEYAAPVPVTIADATQVFKTIPKAMPTICWKRRRSTNSCAKPIPACVSGWVCTSSIAGPTVSSSPTARRCWMPSRACLPNTWPVS